MGGFRISTREGLTLNNSQNGVMVVAPNGLVYSFLDQSAGRAFQHFVDEAMVAGCPVRWGK
jgi:hypothetical protein